MRGTGRQGLSSWRRGGRRLWAHSIRVHDEAVRAHPCTCAGSRRPMTRPGPTPPARAIHRIHVRPRELAPIALTALLFFFLLHCPPLPPIYPAPQTHHPASPICSCNPPRVASCRRDPACAKSRRTLFQHGPQHSRPPPFQASTVLLPIPDFFTRQTSSSTPLLALAYVALLRILLLLPRPSDCSRLCWYSW